MKKMHLHLKKGALHKQLGIKQGSRIPHADLVAAAHSPNETTRKRAQFALNAAKWHHK